ncbi:hypothetical protein DFH06DRAFT_1315572 [Mycena polygramma]|nr:hypothetical protein DFH06DRAFT_1315572 [Mycena polygramma]
MQSQTPGYIHGILPLYYSYGSQSIDLIARGEEEIVKPPVSKAKGKKKEVVEVSDDDVEEEVQERRPIAGSSRVAAAIAASAGPSSSKPISRKSSSSRPLVPGAGSSCSDPRASLPPKSRVPSSLVTTYEELTPVQRKEIYHQAPDPLDPGQILRFAMPPDDVPEEEAARVFAERGQAIYEWYCIMNRINAYLAGEKFINRLIRESDPLRYDYVCSPGLTPAVHSPHYPVPVPELRGDASWRALLRASADQFPPILNMAKSQIGRADLDLLAKGLCRTPPVDLEGWNPTDIYRWVRCEGFSFENLADRNGVPLFLPGTPEPTPSVKSPTPMGPDPQLLAHSVADSAPRTENARPEMFPRESGSLSLPPPLRRSSAPPTSRAGPSSSSSSGPAPPTLTEEDMESLLDKGPSSAPVSRVLKLEALDFDTEMEGVMGGASHSQSSDVHGSSSSPSPHLRPAEEKMDVDGGDAGCGVASGSGA